MPVEGRSARVRQPSAHMGSPAAAAAVAAEEEEGHSLKLGLLGPLPGPPPGFEGSRFHKVPEDRIRFFTEAIYPDPDDRDTFYRVSLQVPSHGVSFNLGQSAEGKALSYSLVHAFYQLPDGTQWRAPAAAAAAGSRSPSVPDRRVSRCAAAEPPSSPRLRAVIGRSTLTFTTWLTCSSLRRARTSTSLISTDRTA